jgi:hypothetical protein
MMMSVQWVSGVLDYDFHPPDDLRLFAVEQAGVLRSDDEAFVTEARHGEVVLRHYAFRDHWVKINCTTDLFGEFVETAFPGGSPFAFNCDIATPMLRAGNAVFAVDLWVDVLVNQDGVTYRVGDEGELAEAIERRWLSDREARGARSGLAQLVALIESGELVEFLSRVHPFGPSSAPEAIPVQHVPLTKAPLLQPHARPTCK